jgi:hypothetical protein
LSLVDKYSGVNCIQETCENEPAFEDAKAFLNHAATVQKYDTDQAQTATTLSKTVNQRASHHLGNALR